MTFMSPVGLIITCLIISSIHTAICWYRSDKMLNKYKQRPVYNVKIQISCPAVWCDEEAHFKIPSKLDFDIPL